MAQRDIPVFVQQLYTYFGIPKSDWQQHFDLDCNGVTRIIDAKAKRVYEILHRDIFDRRAT